MAGLGNFPAGVQTSILYATFSRQIMSVADTSLSLQQTFAERS
ncbi:hypothetical protein [Lysinibacillus sp. Ag94]|nr:hypothetical protein [Lysinibacillus sp. Ag94]